VRVGFFWLDMRKSNELLSNDSIDTDIKRMPNPRMLTDARKKYYYLKTIIMPFGFAQTVENLLSALKI
jgi:hypothetical protein